MKKNILKVIAIFIIMIIISGCIFAYYYFTKEEKKEVISNEILFNIKETPRIDASLATQPLMDALISNFTGVNIKDLNFEYTNTHPAYVKLINGETDLIIVTEPSKEELKLAQSKKIDLEVIPIVREGFVFYINDKNKVNSLSLKQIQKIYSGEITNWKEVGGEDDEITPYQRPINSGSQTGLLSLVMKNKKLMEPKTENVALLMKDIINLVSDFDNGINSIGYSYYYYATTMYETIDKEVANKIKFLAIDGVEPSYTTIKNGKYKLQTNYYIVINKNETKDSKTRKLVEAMLSARGQDVAERTGYVGIK